jgi:hypothetical protein
MANEASVAATNRSLRLIKAVSSLPARPAHPLSASILTRGFTGARISNRLFHHHTATTLLYPCSTPRSDTAPCSFIHTNHRHVAYTAYQPLLQHQPKRESELWRCYESRSAAACLCFGTPNIVNSYGVVCLHSDRRRGPGITTERPHSGYGTHEQ